MQTLLRTVVVAGIGLVVAGCSGDKVLKIKNLVPVTGTVTVDGKPLDHGTIGFAPADKEGQPATGEIKNGQFTMQTSLSAAGVKAAEYQVTVVSIDANAAPKRDPKLPPDPNEKPVELPSLVAKKYNDIKTSELKVTVKSGMPAPKFELTSK